MKIILLILCTIGIGILILRSELTLAAGASH